MAASLLGPRLWKLGQPPSAELVPVRPLDRAARKLRQPEPLARAQNAMYASPKEPAGSSGASGVFAYGPDMLHTARPLASIHHQTGLRKVVLKGVSRALCKSMPSSMLYSRKCRFTHLQDGEEPSRCRFGAAMNGTPCFGFHHLLWMAPTSSCDRVNEQCLPHHVPVEQHRKTDPLGPQIRLPTTQGLHNAHCCFSSAISVFVLSLPIGASMETV